jgi:plastocyanin
MRARLLFASVGVALAATLPAAAADTAPTSMVVATAAHYLPGDRLVPVPMLAVVQGTTVQFANADFTPHSLVSIERDSYNEPIFDSGMLYFGQTAPVAGVERLAPGTYDFYCSAHPTSMRGTLIVAGP